MQQCIAPRDSFLILLLRQIRSKAIGNTMSYNPLFGVGECTAQCNAFYVLWLQHRRIYGLRPENKTFDAFYYHATANQAMRLLPGGRLTMRDRDETGAYNGSVDTRFSDVHCFDLWRRGEDTSLYDWSKRMEREYPWDKYVAVVNPDDVQYLIGKMATQERIREHQSMAI